MGPTRFIVDNGDCDSWCNQLRNMQHMDAGRFHSHAQGSSPLSFTGERVVPNEAGWEWCFEAHRFGYDELVKRINSSDTVLDVGSGEGYGTAQISKKAAFTVGCDYSEEAARHARSKYGSGQVAFIVADAQRLPFKSRSFDVVASLQVIEHFTDTDAHLADVARVMKPEAMHFCATPNIALASAEEAANEWHLRDFDAQTLTEAMTQTFAEVELFGQFYVEDSPRVRAMRAADERSVQETPKKAQIERAVAKLPGPLRVRARKLLRKLMKVAHIDADAVRNEIVASDFVLRSPAEESFCLFAIARKPRL